MIKKKSTGGTLLSLLDEIRAVRIMDIPRTRAQGSKTKRFLDAQPYTAERRISFPALGRHVKLCIDHMSKITANETHRWDDLADTFADGVRVGLIEKALIYSHVSANNYGDIAKTMTSTQQRINTLRKSAYTR